MTVHEGNGLLLLLGNSGRCDLLLLFQRHRSHRRWRCRVLFFGRGRSVSSSGRNFTLGHGRISVDRRGHRSFRLDLLCFTLFHGRNRRRCFARFSLRTRRFDGRRRFIGLRFVHVIVVTKTLLLRIVRLARRTFRFVRRRWSDARAVRTGRIDFDVRHIGVHRRGSGRRFRRRLNRRYRCWTCGRFVDRTNFIGVTRTDFRGGRRNDRGRQRGDRHRLTNRR